ncbi:MAG: SMP-30/gluconolactonase/LRE family protein [Synoicihabitans sp.]
MHGIAIAPLANSDRIVKTSARVPQPSQASDVDDISRRNFLGKAAFTGALVAPFARAANSDLQSDDRSIGPLADSAARIIAVDSRFAAMLDPMAAITRHQTGSKWSEGPAWNAAGKYLVWSDVRNNRQLRWLEEDGHVSEFRNPSNHTNGCTFDAYGRMLTCEQVGRQVVRHEGDGSTTMLANSIDGVSLNSPNDIVVHPNGGVWFTDPGYGAPKPLPQKEAIYRIDGTTGVIARVSDALSKPNGLCFSPDFTQLYIADTGLGKENALFRFDVVAGRRLTNPKPFAQIRFNELAAGPDGQQVDAQGNLWASSGHGVDGINGVHVFDPAGTLLGVILLPETCANVCFGGTNQDRLFMTATTSLYSVPTLTRAAHGA